jgi:tripartite-type tricarboxylate transporter receptor subunit TctC
MRRTGSERRSVAAVALLLLGAQLGCQRVSGPYPSREIALVVQASPGGLSDTVSRVMASLVEEDLGVPVVCENRPGASGALAFSFVTRRPPDGYTLGHGPVEIAMVRALGYAEVGPDDMSLICLVSSVAPVLVVREGSRWASFEAFVAEGRREPGALIIANSGVGSIWHFNTLLLEKHTGMRVTHLPYGGSSPGLVALLGGHVDAAIAGVSEVISHVQAGSLRPLLVFAEERPAVLPDTPTSYELGYPMAAPAWSGFYGPGGIPGDVRVTLERAFRAASESERWAKLCRERGVEPLFLGREAFEAFAEEQAAFFAAEIPSLVRLTGAAQ